MEYLNLEYSLAIPICSKMAAISNTVPRKAAGPISRYARIVNTVM